MARKGHQDRGLMSKTDTTGKLLWYVRLMHDGKDRRFGSFPTKTKARQFYEKAKKEQHENRFFPERYQHGGYELVQEAIDRYVVSMQGTKSYRDHVYFAKWWGKQFAGKRLNAITVAGLESLREEMRACRSDARANRYLRWLRACLNVAIKHDKLTVNPVAKLKSLPEPETKTRLLTLEEEGKLMTAIGPTHAPWVRFAVLTGLRQKEQFTLEWANVDLELGLITLPETKAGGVQYAPLNAEAKEILRNLDSWQRSKWVFPSGNPATHRDPRKFCQKVYIPAMRQSGIPWTRWHDLRHCFASRLAMSNAPLGTIAALLRHSGTGLVKRYAHLSPSHLRDAVEMVSVFGQDQKPDREGQSQKETVTATGMREERKVRNEA
ncbi:MAG: site-specific integrase [Nitrospinae bacterium]|nr:site-specific integrase [Nitrospinota bacterium]